MTAIRRIAGRAAALVLGLMIVIGLMPALGSRNNKLSETELPQLGMR